MQKPIALHVFYAGGGLLILEDRKKDVKFNDLDFHFSIKS
jgi:hypothetical protein